MWAALGWGAVAAGSVVIGALLALLRKWHHPTVGFVLAFGAGALISSVAYELVEDGIRTSGPVPLGIGLALGALAFYLADRKVERMTSGGSGGVPLALGALLDGIPEQLVLGIGLASGGGVSLALLGSVFVSNLPEGLGSSAEMLESGRSRRSVIGLWSLVAAVCTLATLAGYALAEVLPEEVATGVNGFAAGALLVMLTDSMIPEAEQKAPGRAGLATVLGFALAMALSLLQ
ncbi:Zinc transporter ZupT [Propionicimonas sp. T2.31MG-18]|uniref:ZIP family metal transporter n=1 Tax=Propionicimonas sp. T2.31MG-18 TaxID=3157620 RepID=UPI0035E5BC2E